VSEEETFKVTDRRRRPDADLAPGAPPPAPVAPATPPPAAPIAASSPDVLALDEAGSEPDLQGVFAMFASSALTGLGAAPDPATGERYIDLEQAQEAIEVLLLLRVKTEGNRTEEETRVLEEILYELQLRFAQVSQGGR
jgi:hypothetical protein